KVKLATSPPLNKAPISGIIISSTNEETIFPNTAPILTATTKSNTFPSKANFLKSSHIFLHITKYVIEYDPIYFYHYIQPLIIIIKNNVCYMTIIDAITYFIIVCYNTIEESVCFGNDMTVSSFNWSLSFSV